MTALPDRLQTYFAEHAVIPIVELAARAAHGLQHPETAYCKARKWKAAGVVARIHDLRHTTGMRPWMKGARSTISHSRPPRARRRSDQRRDLVRGWSGKSPTRSSDSLPP
jgi:hypothetical protein